VGQRPAAFSFAPISSARRRRPRPRASRSTSPPA
jgi:hypothetical protein